MTRREWGSRNSVEVISLAEQKVGERSRSRGVGTGAGGKRSSDKDFCVLDLLQNFN